MIGDFPDPDSLPGGRRTGPLSDISTYRMLLVVATNIVQHCVQLRGEMGWQSAGMISFYHFCQFVTLIS